MHRTLVPLALVVVLAFAIGAQAPPRGGVSEVRYLGHVRFLASDALGGRGNGTPGLERAAEYIAAQFAKAGLQPGVSGGWFQPFQIVTGLEVRPGNRLAINGAKGRLAFDLGRTYYPISVVAEAGTPGPVAEPQLPVVFAGYGISAPTLNYDDYEGIDARGKAVVIFMDEPQENDEKSPFDGQAFTQHASLMQKAMVAREHGARLVLLAIDPSHDTDSDTYAGWLRDPQADDYGLAVLRVERGHLQQALGPSIDLAATARDIDANLTPRSRPLPGVTVESVEHYAKVRREVRNVVGLLKGADPTRAGEAVVVGAHYDHLGLGGRHSLAPDATGQIHNGADDNASGTAALLEIAYATGGRPAPPRTLVFVAFAAEELGLLGSTWYLDHPVIPVEETTAMVNLDMIGRPAGRVLVSGVESAPNLDADLKAASEGRGIEIRSFREGAGVGSSDDTSFLLRKVPSIGFFSGYHADYHRPSDDADKIDVPGATEVTRIALSLVERIARRTERAVFVESSPQPRQTPRGGGSGYGPYFGSVPDFGDTETGVKFADVRAGSPAEKAGLRRGDVLISFGGAPIKNTQDFTFQLRSRKPGDKVKVVVIRDRQEVTADVTLGTRP